MYYISKVENDRYYITDTKDNVEEQIPLNIIMSYKGRIKGVYTDANVVIPVVLLNDLKKQLVAGNFNIIGYMGIKDAAEFYLDSKPNSSGIATSMKMRLMRIGKDAYTFATDGACTSKIDLRTAIGILNQYKAQYDFVSINVSEGFI